MSREAAETDRRPLQMRERMCREITDELSRDAGNSRRVTARSFAPCGGAAATTDPDDPRDALACALNANGVMRPAGLTT